MELRDSLQLIDMDKGGEGLGPLFEEPRRRLQDEPAFRAAWSQYQAVKALAWEAAPELDERLLRQGLQASRRQDVERRLARAAGSQDAARELLLKPEGAKSGLPVWASFLLLAGALGLGWMAFGPSSKGAIDLNPAPLPTAVPDAPLAFEFPASGTAETGMPPQGDDVHSNDPATREARRLVNENLRAAAEAKEKPAPTELPTPRPKPKAKAVVPHSAPTKAVPRPSATMVPTLRPTAAPPEIEVVPLIKPTQAAVLPTSVPTQAPVAMASTPAPAAAAPSSSAKSALFEAVEGPSSEASLSLSNNAFPVWATLSLPETGDVDLRLFDMRGRLVRRYAEGPQPQGRWKIELSSLDDQGQPLPPGNYYLRAITRWFSKVEAIDQP